MHMLTHPAAWHGSAGCVLAREHRTHCSIKAKTKTYCCCACFNLQKRWGHIVATDRLGLARSAPSGKFWPLRMG
jgi:hypothetical protein